VVDAASCELGVIVSLLPFCAETKNEWNCAFTHRYAFIEKKKQGQHLTFHQISVAARKISNRIYRRKHTNQNGNSTDRR